MGVGALLFVLNHKFMIDQIIDFNKSFVAQKGYEKYLTDKYPDKKLAVLSCMDTRLTELLPAALGLKNGDAKIIKNAGLNGFSTGDDISGNSDKTDEILEDIKEIYDKYKK